MSGFLDIVGTKKGAGVAHEENRAWIMAGVAALAHAAHLAFALSAVLGPVTQSAARRRGLSAW
ncbi:hypothetical protein [Streptomyces uncialis]|uniref:hypothetical protein n=1 Tax=Streptomyces uncialis TaxID=1048205 RepID=UPI002256193F|nr:hypothetical protein [Streptomyces uncialis]